MTEKMMAIVKSKPQPGEELLEVPIPNISKIGKYYSKYSNRDVLVKIKAASICGTDVHIHKWDEWSASRIKPPLIIGHEFAGEIVEIGKEVTKFKIGDIVSGETHLNCGYCFQCRIGHAHICENMKLRGIDTDGCFAEYHVSHEDHLWKNPDNVPIEVASVQEPLGNAVHSVFSQNIAGKTVSIFGCGCIGQSAIQLCRSIGALKIIAVDVRPYRLSRAKGMGADIVINALEEDPVKRIMEETITGVDVFLEMAGFEKSLQQGLASLRPGGDAAILGVFSKPVTIDFTNDIVFKNITMRGIFGRKMFNTWYKTAALLKEKKIDLSKLITHRMKLQDFNKAMDLMISGECGKIVLTP